ncbi:hypothetical protein PAPHI01_1607 [Pancytospora philotis]|nr:hypothetical protein PAPHI01_1607 [Pancytospora philotis]
MSIVVSSFGTGILYMPASFRLLGYAYALVAISLVGLLTYFTLYALAYAALVKEGAQDVAYAGLAGLFSPRLRRAVEVTLVGSNAGIAVALVRYFCRSASSASAALGISPAADTLYRPVLCAVAVALVLICRRDTVRMRKHIVRTSLAGVLYYLALAVYYALAHGKDTAQLVARSTDDLCAGFIRFVFALHCQFSFPSIFSEMADKSAASVSQVCALASAAVVLVYAASGFFGYKAVGAEIGGQQILEVFNDRSSSFMQHVMKNSFDKYGVLPSIAQAFFLFISFWSAVFLSIPVVQTLASLCFSKDSKHARAICAAALALVYFAANYSLAFNTDTVLNVSAALFTAPLSFGYPALFMILVSRRCSAASVLSYLIIAATAALAISILHGTLLAPEPSS